MGRGLDRGMTSITAFHTQRLQHILIITTTSNSRIFILATHQFAVEVIVSNHQNPNKYALFAVAVTCASFAAVAQQHQPGVCWKERHRSLDV